MKRHTKIYLQGMGFDDTDFVPCEVCGSKAQDIHHIEPRGMGGRKSKDVFENLVALCRSCHHEADFGTKLPKHKLKQIIETSRKSR